MKNKDFYRQMQLQEQEKRVGGNEGTADLYRAVHNHLKCFRAGKVLTLKEVNPQLMIASLDLHDEPKKQLAVDLALFSFMTCGIPFVDIIHFTSGHIKLNIVL